MRTGRQIDGSADFRLVVREVFLSVQGEGRNVGMPSVFVRTSGCDHACSWCDTPEARDHAGGEELSFPELMSRVRRYGNVRRVCLTGGEPLEQANAKMFVQMLLNNGYAVDLETNGSRYLGDMPTHPALTISMDVKTPSSGMSGRTRPDNVAFLGPGDQLKFIIGDGADHDYALDFVGRHRPACRIILTPVGGLELEPLIGLVLASEAWKDWPVQVLPQLHKVVWGDRKGV